MRLLAAFLAVGILAGCSTPGPQLTQPTAPQAQHTSGPQLTQSTDPYSSKSEYSFGPLIPQSCGTSPFVDGIVDIVFIGVGDVHVMSVGYTGKKRFFP